MESTNNLPESILKGSNTAMEQLLLVKMIGYESKKAKVFDSDEINKFLLEAHDVKYLTVKVVFVFGISGGCRSGEITKVLFEHVIDA
ncbi:hypothetical protein Bhyg_13090, partial [Pseudolycoriella hygida]